MTLFAKSLIMFWSAIIAIIIIAILGGSFYFGTMRWIWRPIIIIKINVSEKNGYRIIDKYRLEIN